ncbi:MAG: hypothetical protein LH609_23350 [Rudanella sp.]|nr:hypothetical protein [Rudanella sp.]
MLTFISQIQTNSGDADVLVLGDLNAYNEEDPIDVLRAGGLTKLTTATESYVFQGQTGSLDHSLATPGLLTQVTMAAKWNINADEPTALDYNDNVLSSGEANSELRNDVSLYVANPFRSSDHDPVLVGLNLTGPLTATLVASTLAVCPGTPVNFSATVAGLSGAPYALTITNGTNQTTASGLSASAVTLSITPAVPGAFTLTVLTSTALTTSALSGTVTINTVPTNASLTSGTLTCSQTSVTLTASATGGTSYTFSGGTPLGNNQVVVSAGGNYTVTVSNVSGCTASATATVSSSINAPTAPTYTLSSNGTVCVGNALTVTANGCNTGTVSFTINPPINSGVTLSGPPAAYVFGTNTPPGTYTVCARCTNTSTGCSSPMALTTVTIAPIPQATLQASSVAFCSNSSVTLTASGGTNYAFTGPSTQNSTSPVFVVTQAGTYTVVVTNAAGCSNTATVTISVLLSGATFTLPASASTVCEGSSFSLPVTVSGSGTMFQWYRNGVLLANQTSATLTLGSVQLSDAGTYSLINGGCGNNGNSGSSPFILTVNPLPTITLTFPGGTLTNSLPTIQLPTPGQVLVQASGGVSYDWTLVIDRINGFEIRKVLTNTNGLFTIDQPGPYRVTVTGTNGCTRTVAGTIVN